MANRIQKQISLSSREQIQALEDIATEMGAGHVSGLMQAIARREIPLGPQATWSEREQAALVQAALALRDRSEIAASRELVNLLWRYSDISLELRLVLDESFGLFSCSSIEKVQACIEKQQPFQLSYLDAANRHWTYTVRYAETAFREKRNYLECWCSETEGNQDLPELRHNWSLRLDRIKDALVIPVAADWRQGLDTIDVAFELFGGLAHAYQRRATDISSEWLSAEPLSLRVTRQISNTFWFLREVLPYGKDCLVLSPDAVRSRVKEEYEAALNKYQS